MTTVLLTGAAGKVGKHVMGALGRRGLKGVATDIASDGIPEGVRFERCDLTDADAVQRMVARVKPDVVVHGWFYECWMDARESQEVLGFQTISFPAFMKETRKQNRFKRLLLAPLGPLLIRSMVANSPYLGKGAIEPGPTLLDDLDHVFGVQPSAAVSSPRTEATSSASPVR
jgi:NAD(P)-dependent dehydrogenase (short-subunit alcohol dehydrogenase family)